MKTLESLVEKRQIKQCLNLKNTLYWYMSHLLWDDLLAVPEPRNVRVRRLHVNVELDPVVLHRRLPRQLRGECMRVF